MRNITAILGLFFLLLAGCNTWQTKLDAPVATVQGGKYTGFAPASIEILPLTHFTKAQNQIISYVSLLDSYGIQIKWPGAFRFELYEAKKLSGETKGRRVAIWPDIDLTQSSVNNEFWQDFIRTYKFELDFKGEQGQRYVLVITFLGPESSRVSNEYLFSVK